jgi:hypothetical protein
MRLTSTQIKKVVNIYIKRYRPTLLRLPSSMYKNSNLLENIVKACAYFGKQPGECDMTLNCKIFYDVQNTRVTTIPPMQALSAVGKSGVKISLNIMFDDPSVDLWSSYISTLEKIVEFLPHTKSLHIDFPDRIKIMEDWGNDVINILSQMTQLTSLSICKMHVTGTELIECLSEMTRLSSFSISEIFIEGLYCYELGPNLEKVLPNLSKLKLSNSSVDFESIIDVLPYIRSLLSNLTSLDISINGIDRNKLYNIVPEISGYVSNLRTLNLSHNEIGMYIEGVPHPIILLIQSLNNLEQLNLSDNSIDGIAELIPSLQMLPLLRNLDLSNNNLCVNEIELITRSLPMLKVLNVIDDDQTGRMESID